MEQKTPGRWAKAAPILILLLALLAAAAFWYQNRQGAEPGGESSASGSSASTAGSQVAAASSEEVPVFAASSEPEGGEASGDSSQFEEKPSGQGESPAAGNAEDTPKPEPPKNEPTDPVVRSGSDYDFTQPVPESEPVSNEYFKTAAFVGDSRTEGFLIYSGVGGGKNLTSNGLSIFQLAEKKAMTIGGKDYTLLEALAMDSYDKVYLSLGVNELGVYNDEGFYRSYCEAIDDIRAIQPDAVIYIQGLIPLNEGVIAQTIKRDYLTNEHLRVYNDLMRKAAQEKQVAFLDLYSAFVDENGELPADASRDGVHLSKDYCKKWLAYLQTHTVTLEELYGPPVEEDPLPDEIPEPEDGEPTENGSAET